MNYIERYWRDATPADAIKEPPMVARFRMHSGASWLVAELHGTHTRDGRVWFNKAFCNSWNQCQVYDAPDPGDGWRLIDIDEDDYRQDGIEYWNTGEKKWLPRDPRNGKITLLPFVVYRIRIAPTVTYVPFTWEDRDQLRGRWIYRVHANGTHDERIIGYAQQAANGDIDFGGFFPETLFSEWTFIDTGEPVGKKVTQ